MAGTYGTKRGLIAFGSAGSQKRDVGGRFAAGGRAIDEIQKLNEAAAKAFQAHLVETVENMEYKRPTVRSGRLVRAMANNRNRAADRFGWGVGDTEYLDQSVAKYWRTIEEGSAKTWPGGMVGLEIYGTWGSGISGFYRNRWGLVPRASGTFNRLGDSNGQGKLRGMNHEWARARKIQPMIVKHEIEPHGYFKTARETYEPTREWVGRVEAILRNGTRQALRGSSRA